MRGSRPLSPEEVKMVFAKLGSLNNRFALRNQLMFLMGVKTGFRISELLSIRVKDVIQHGKLVTKVTVTRAAMKGKIESRAVALHEECKPLIQKWVTEAGLEADDFLFASQRGGNLTREMAHRILKEAYECCRLTGKLGTHACRKTFADQVYNKLGHDLVKTQKALGHKWVSTTAQYISFREEEVDEAILAS